MLYFALLYTANDLSFLIAMVATADNRIAENTSTSQAHELGSLAVASTGVGSAVTVAVSHPEVISKAQVDIVLSSVSAKYLFILVGLIVN